ncbi:MAG: MBL fold metallo-hydrolase [Burkholderiaceae bacterium]|jgi:glyoxylase-like metal-dependent hydrolase (beta-lactamase superfamily II)|nr:MBL fold metallo-hydrolase [Burkholderiaceae bacterium]
MNHAESQLHYPLGESLPASGTAIELAPGIRWIRMALPFALDHINLWLLRDRVAGKQGVVDGWTVVDCCIDSPAARAQWEAVFSSALEGLPIVRVIATHMHPDHLGLAHWLCERWSAPLWISATDYYTALAASTGSLFPSTEALSDFYRSHGLSDAEFHARLKDRGSYYAGLVPKLPMRFHRMMDGDRIRIGGHDFECIAGYGHAPEHIALHCATRGVLISGDMVLPRISTNVSVFAGEPDADPLKLFLTSLKRFEALSDVTLVLPSHGKPFIGLGERLQQLQEHHQEHLSVARAACSEQAHSAAELLPKLFRRELDTQQLSFALGETLAHLHWLWHAGMVSRAVDPSGVYRFCSK